MVKFYSQFGEDKWIKENIELPTHGVFCEVGVGHPYEGSNTLMFEEMGWQGVLIEPDPRSWKLIEATRKARLETCAVGAPVLGGWVDFNLNSDPTLSGIGRRGTTIRVPIRPLISVIGEVDLLSIDTEGTELDVWASYELKPKVVIVEWNTIGIDSQPQKILDQFAKDGYRNRHTTECNFIFERIT